MAGALVCIVDDDISIRESLAALISQKGYSVRAFGSAEEFGAEDAAELCRCLILDLVMSGMCGLDLHRELRTRGYRIPTIIITAYVDSTLRSRLLADGFIAYLEKPFDGQAVLNAIRSAIGDVV